MGLSRWRIGPVALGAILIALMGSGLFALASDSVTSAGNDATSGTYKHDLKVARVASSDPLAACDAVNYQDTTGPTFTLANINYATQFTQSVYQSDNFCFKNAGPLAARLMVSFINVVDTEVGACEQSEADAGDTDCIDLEPGELSPIMQSQFDAYNNSATAACTDGFLVTGRTPTYATPQQIIASIPAGGSCRIRASIYVNPSQETETDKLQAQTDRVTWDIVFTLQDTVA